MRFGARLKERNRGPRTHMTASRSVRSSSRTQVWIAFNHQTVAIALDFFDQQLAGVGRVAGRMRSPADRGANCLKCVGVSVANLRPAFRVRILDRARRCHCCAVMLSKFLRDIGGIRLARCHRSDAALAGLAPDSRGSDHPVFVGKLLILGYRFGSRLCLGQYYVAIRCCRDSAFGCRRFGFARTCGDEHDRSQCRERSRRPHSHSIVPGGFDV